MATVQAAHVHCCHVLAFFMKTLQQKSNHSSSPEHANQKPKHSKPPIEFSGSGAKNSDPVADLPNTQPHRPMKDFEEFTEAGFTDKQSRTLADVVGLIRQDIQKLTTYMVARFASMNEKIDQLKTSTNEQIGELKTDTKERFKAADKKIDDLKISMNEKIGDLKADNKERFEAADKKFDELRSCTDKIEKGQRWIIGMLFGGMIVVISLLARAVFFGLPAL